MKPARTVRHAALGVATTFCALPAWAHGDLERLGPFYAGALHPLVVPGHALALVSIGLLVGQRGLPAEARSLTGLAIGLALGLALAVAGTPTAGLPVAVSSVVLLLGALSALLAVTARSVPGPLGVVLAAGIGLGVGLDSVPDAAAGFARWSALAGTGLGALAAAALIAALVSTVSEGVRGRVPRLGVRVLASWLVASALLTLALGSLGARDAGPGKGVAQASGSAGATSATTRPQDQ